MVDEVMEEAPVEEQEPKKRTKIVFTGRGFHKKVPARDLSKAEWNALPKDFRESLLRQGIYEEI